MTANRLWAFTAYSLGFEALVWGAGFFAVLAQGHSLLWLLIPGAICASNEHLKLATWRGAS